MFSGAPPKDDLQTAIELSLQKSQAEEIELNRAARVKRKSCEAQGESCSPADWIRQDGWPVGIHNMGNTCWFSAVIQSLFHLPVFRRLVLNYCLSERILEKCKSHSDKRNIAFLQELRCLFALMVGSTRRFVDPSAAVELLREAFRSSEAQQDVSECTHKLLDWLEDAFQLAANGNSLEDKKENPMVQLFYGTFVAERTHEGKTLSNIEQFGQYPLQVNGFNNLEECLEGAMVEGEIEALHPDQTISSGSKRWFSKLPPVLTFELSRFEFNQSLGRPEKIHKKLEFPQIIYMDRYLHKNNEQTHNRRGEVKRLKEHLTVLQQKLECYRSYGSGPTNYPLADMLQYMLEFACTKPTSVSPAEDPRLAASSPTPPSPSDSSTCQQKHSSSQRMPVYKPFTQCRPPMDAPPHPAPHSVTEEELRFVKTCLQRWRTEMENNMDGTLCIAQVPYRLHAVLVHEGQALAGHYWAYIYDHSNQCWMKYNDVIVSESSWEELVRDSYGGMTNASAYCLMYIDNRLPHLIAEDTDDETGQVMQGMDSLPPILGRYVREDNHWFQQELREWEEQLYQPPQEEPAAPTAASTSTRVPSKKKDEAAEPVPQPGPAQEPTGEQGQEPEAELMMLTPAMQGIIMAIAKARQAFDNEGPEAGLIKAFQEEYSRLFELSQEETTAQQDPRLHHALVYFFQNKAPNRVIERTLLDGFTDRNLSFDDMSISIMREARAKLRLIKPEDMDMEEYMQWHDDYSLFRTVFVYLLTGLEQYQHGKVREALNYLNHAYKDNTMLLRRGEKRGVEQSLIALYRRRCLKELNDNAATLFRSSEVSGAEEGVIIMNEAVIPCMHLMSRPDMISQEDLDTMEAIRSHWCSYLEVDLDDSLQLKLGEFLPRVLDCSTERVFLKDPPTVLSKVPHDLCSRLAAIMESITNTSVVAVK
uniref:Ubiquitin carboxyl-terminal hydrolase n=1 Tax=Oncorhynchus mykiss TaxID=8022 RepID=A0A8C7TLI1_ONCMY